MDRKNMVSGLVRGEIKSLLKSMPQQNSDGAISLLSSSLTDKMDELIFLMKSVSGKSNGETILDIDTGTGDTIEKLMMGVREMKDELSKLPENLHRMIIILQEIYNKDIKIPEQKEVKFPIVQKVDGNVSVSNQPDMTPLKAISSDIKNLLIATQSLKKSIDSINLSPHITVPKIEIPQQKGMNSVEIKQMVKLLSDMKEELSKLPKEIKIPETVFPSKISVDNFPPTKYPMPVTNININPLRGFIKTRTVTVKTLITPLPEEVLSYRRSLIIYNNSDKTVEVGGSTMSYGNGFPVESKTYSPPFDAGPKMIIYGIVDSGTAEVRVLELSNENIGG